MFFFFLLLSYSYPLHTQTLISVQTLIFLDSDSENSTDFRKKETFLKTQFNPPFLCFSHLHDLVENNLVVGYSFGAHRHNFITHLQLADDTLLVGEKSWTNNKALKAILILFEAVYGLKVNFHKSVMVGVNINDSWLHEAALVLNCKHNCLPFLYMRLPIGGDP